ncbi:restriction endonuclease subunit S [Arthrobacter sp. W4I7]|uniref:restriction endonuclease subunit S n=1 Tax=Arthrobacter sp. W4I7 TaxID=3042296 RepID=UPI00278392D6|nr:restriction endonuclease subunit S [Arthrobacter sp. W4I7]MDQ0689587.1 type I restriction enzyme S subunit [Arthrobacter sp. W4I7]
MTTAATWPTRRLREISTKIQDGTHFSPQLGGSEYRYITSKNIGPGHLKLDSVDMISESEHRKIYERCDVKFGDLLLTKDGANTGNAALSTFHDEISLLSSVAFIRANRAVALERYILHYFLSRPGRKQIQDAMAGNAITRLTLQKINDLTIELPPIEEQGRIADALDAADGMINALDLLIAKKRAIKQGMMQKLLIGKTRLAGFTQPWRTVHLGDVAQFGKGMGLPKSDMEATGKYSCVHYGELFTRYGAEIKAVISRTNNASLGVRSSALDVLMPTSDVTPRGLAKASAIHDAGVILGGDILIIRPDPRQLYGPFLAHAIRQDANQILQLVRGSTVFHIYATDMRSFAFQAPAADEQRAICNVLGDVQQEIELLGQRVRKARAMKQGMMQQLLTGSVRLQSTEVSA